MFYLLISVRLLENKILTRKSEIIEFGFIYIYDSVEKSEQKLFFNIYY